MKLRFLFFVVFMVLFGFAGAASSADEVVVDVVAATQYETLFVARVVAHGGTDLDVQLSVDGASLGEPDTGDKTVICRRGLLRLRQRAVCD
jgi:hypothetical protein